MPPSRPLDAPPAAVSGRIPTIAGRWLLGAQLLALLSFGILWGTSVALASRLPVERHALLAALRWAGGRNLLCTGLIVVLAALAGWPRRLAGTLAADAATSALSLVLLAPLWAASANARVYSMGAAYAI